MRQASAVARMCRRTKNPEIARRLVGSIREMVDDPRSTPVIREWCTLALHSVIREVSRHDRELCREAKELLVTLPAEPGPP